MEEPSVVVLEDYRVKDKTKCRRMFEQNATYIALCKEEILKKNSNPANLVILLFDFERCNCADLDVLLAAKLRHHCEESSLIRDISTRAEIDWTLWEFDPAAAEKLHTMKTSLVVVVIDGENETADVFAA